MLVGLPPAVGVLARIPGHKGVERFLRWTGLSPRGFLGLMGPSGPRVVVSPPLAAMSINAACGSENHTTAFSGEGNAIE